MRGREQRQQKQGSPPRLLHRSPPQPPPHAGCHTPTLPPAHRNFHGRREPLQTEAGAAVALNDNSGSQRVTAISLSITQRAIQQRNEFNKAHRLLRRHGDQAAGASGIKGFVAPLSAQALPPPFQTLLFDFNPAQPHCGGGTEAAGASLYYQTVDTYRTVHLMLLIPRHFTVFVFTTPALSYPII